MQQPRDNDISRCRWQGLRTRKLPVGNIQLRITALPVAHFNPRVRSTVLRQRPVDGHSPAFRFPIKPPWPWDRWTSLTGVKYKLFDVRKPHQLFFVPPLLAENTEGVFNIEVLKYYPLNLAHLAVRVSPLYLALHNSRRTSYGAARTRWDFILHPTAAFSMSLSQTPSPTQNPDQQWSLIRPQTADKRAVTLKKLLCNRTLLETLRVSLDLANYGEVNTIFFCQGGQSRPFYAPKGLQDTIGSEYHSKSRLQWCSHSLR